MARKAYNEGYRLNGMLIQKNVNINGWIERTEWVVWDETKTHEVERVEYLGYKPKSLEYWTDSIHDHKNVTLEEVPVGIGPNGELFGRYNFKWAVRYTTTTTPRHVFRTYAEAKQFVLSN